jgi:hypothetical protein
MSAGARCLRSKLAEFLASKTDGGVHAFHEEVEQEKPRVRGSDLTASIHE